MTISRDSSNPELSLSATSWPGNVQWKWTKRFARRQPVGFAALVFVLGIAALAVFADFARTSDPQTIDPRSILHGPSWEHWFGTNRQGNDVWSRVVYGARPSLIIGATTVAIGLGGGCALGLLAGYFGGILDFVISRIAEFVISFPPIIVGIVVAAALRPGLRSVIIAITIVVIAATTRLMRVAVLQQRSAVYVEAARVIGASQLRIIVRHILPNVVPLAIVVATAMLPTAILFESAVTFLGFGLPQGEPSWGADLGGQTRTFFQVAPWLAIFPGIALSLTITAFNLLGDALRDELDPRLRNR